MTTIQLITELKGITQTNIDLLKKKFTHLNETQKNWRKDSESWNLNEIFAHLNEFSFYYHPAFISKIKRTKYKEAKDIFISSPLGRSAWKSMKLGNAQNIKRKFKSPKVYNPFHIPELVTGTDIETFQKSQADLLEIIDKAATVNMRKVKIPISISKIVRLRLGDALLYVIYHNERHMQQALNVLNHTKFPKK